MASFGYERLSFLDHSFLIAESATHHMHIAGTATYEKDTGHWVLEERPRETTDALLAFL